MSPGAGSQVRYFDFEGCRLAYTDFGSGDRALVLVHGQLLSQLMHRPLAESLAAGGHRVITMDVLGHGASDHPTEMWRYSMTQFAEQVVGLLDHLGIGRAVVGGTSLGANVGLEFGAIAPERAQGLLVEMPVLDEGVYGAVVVFTPLLTIFQYARPAVRLAGFLARLVPRAVLPFLGNVMLDTIRQDHTASAAVLQGMFLGRIAPQRGLLRKFTMPVLVIGHHHDPIHPLVDARTLASEIPGARLIEATSVLEMRLHPERLTAEIGRFLDQCWEEPQETGREAVKVRPANRPVSRRRPPVRAARAPATSRRG